MVGTKNSLKSAVVSLFVEGVLEIEEDEKGMCSVCVCDSVVRWQWRGGERG